MTFVHWLLGAALATAQAPSPPSAFPCDKLRPGFLEIYDGFELEPVPAPAPVEVKKKAMLYDRALALAARTFTPADAGRDGEKTLAFRRYRDGGETILCADQRSDALFGAGDETTHFGLRCLADRDGDGLYDGFTHRIRLVRFRIDKPIPRTQGPDASEFKLFATPLELVERPGLVGADANFRPRARRQISVIRVQGDEVELRFAGGIDNLPDHATLWAGRPMRGAAGSTIVSVPMTDGAVVPIAGTRIRFAKAKGKWRATVLDGFGSEPKLLCSGSVAEVGDTFTIMGAGGVQSMFARSSLPPAN